MIKNRRDEKVYEDCLGNYCIKIYENDRLFNETWYNKYHWIHRDDDFPAFTLYLEYNIYSQEWYKDNRKHRENDLPARIVYRNNSIFYKEWFKRGFLHRENDLPAFEGEIEKRWYYYGHLHREKGPSVISISGRQEWWFYGICKKIISDFTYYSMLQLHKYRKYANLNPINKSWYNSKILEPKLIRIIISYLEKTKKEN